MPWGHTSCPAITGWQNRAQGKVAAAGVAGMFVGAVLSVLHQKHFLRHSVGTAASCMICTGGFVACQELSRLLRCEDSAANSIVAGAATGALLLGLQRGKGASLPGAIVCGGAAGAGHLLYDKLQPVQMVQQWLVQNDLMDAPGMQPIHTAKDYHQLGNQNPSPSGNRWGDTFGIKHLSDAEWEEYERRQKVDFDRRLAKAGLSPDERRVRQQSRTDQ